MAIEPMWELTPELGYLAHEHIELRRALQRLPFAVIAARGHVRRELRPQLAVIDAWLEREVVPHLRWEESVFHPELERLAGLASLSDEDRAERERCAVQITRLRAVRNAIDEELTPGQGAEACSALEALHELLLGHIDREDRLAGTLVARGRLRRDRSVRSSGAGSLDPRAGPSGGPRFDP